MNLYTMVIFAHVIGMLGFAIALGFEWIVLGEARAARTNEEAQGLIRVTGALPAFGLGSLAFAVLTGCYLAAHSSTWGAGWMRVSLGILVLIVVLGAIGGARMRALRRCLATGDLRHLIADPRLLIPIRVRASVSAGIVFLMVARPSFDMSMGVAAAAIVFGLLWGARG